MHIGRHLTVEGRIEELAYIPTTIAVIQRPSTQLALLISTELVTGTESVIHHNTQALDGIGAMDNDSMVVF